MAWLANRFPLEPGRRGRAIAVHLGACVLFGIVHLAGASFLSDYVFYSGFPLSYWDNLKRLFTVYFVSIEVGYYWAFVGVTLAVDYRQKYREREREAAELALRASRLEASLARANLEALRMQLNPHFLFNTLNAVSVLAMKGERQTVVRMLARLSDLLRMAFENGAPVVPLAEELNLLEPYLEIERVRFRDRLQGFGVLDRIRDEFLPEIVFVTAYDQFALRAFEAHALDYLLKPFDSDRFRRTLDRVRTHLRGRRLEADARLLSLLDEMRNRPRYLERLVVRSGGRILILRTDDIDWIEAAANYVKIHAAGRTYLLRETMTNMEKQLDPARFIRIHRSTIVRVERIRLLEPLLQGDFLVVLEDGSRLPSSRGYRENLQALMAG